MASAPDILPLTAAWYRRLLGLSILIGAGAGLAAVAYSEFTAIGTDFFFGDPTSDPFSGEWWWIPLLSAGAMLIVWLRRRAGVAGDVPGAVAYARRGWVEPSSAIPLFVISALSLFVGASLGPSFGIVISGGGLASWLAERASLDDTESRQEYALTGMAGGLSAVFAAPLFGSIMASELSPTSKSRYVASFIPMFVASVVGFVVFSELSGAGLFGAFQMPGYEYETVHLLYGCLLGVLAVVVLLVLAVIGKVVRGVAARLRHDTVRAAVLGGVVGLAAFALPLTATGGSTQLAFETTNFADLGTGLLVAVLLVKIVAFVASQEAGFLGGPVFPILFIGGTAGLIVHAIFPDIPAPLSVAALAAALPAATIAAPVSFTILAGGVVVVGLAGLAPIGLAVVTAHLAVWGLEIFRDTRDAM